MFVISKHQIFIMKIELNVIRSEKPVSKNFSYRLTDEEKAEIAIELSSVYTKMESLKEEFKSVKKQYDAKIQEQLSKFNELNGKVQSGVEMRIFQCIVVKNFDLGKKFYEDIRTGETLHSEQLDTDDYQLQLEIDRKRSEEHTLKPKDDFFDEPVVNALPEKTPTMDKVFNEAKEQFGETLQKLDEPGDLAKDIEEKAEPEPEAEKKTKRSRGKGIQEQIEEAFKAQELEEMQTPKGFMDEFKISPDEEKSQKSPFGSDPEL
jgi:hypothetical protein